MFRTYLASRRPLPRPLSLLCVLGAGASAASAQIHSSDAVPVTGAIKHAGTYHVATGTWTRGSGASAKLGPDVVYSNTAESGYYFNSLNYGDTSEHIDEGAVPGASNANHQSANRDEYNVDCVDVAYCDFGGAGTGGWELAFYNSYDLCRGPAMPDTILATGGLPANGCWTVQLDLTGAPICLLAAFGSLSVAANDLQLVATVSPGSFGFFITSQTMVTPAPVGAGLICIGGNVGRFSLPGQIKQADAAGLGMSLDTTVGEWSLAGIPTSTGPYTAAAGNTTYFQCWHRDVVNGALTSNFTDGYSLTWVP